MSSRKIGLKEEVSIIDKMILLEKSTNAVEQILVPENKAEMFIPLNGEFQLKPIDSVRSIYSNEDEGCFFMPRRKGMKLKWRTGSECLLLKINPLYARKMSEQLEEISNCIYKVALSNDFMKLIVDAFESHNIYYANVLLESKYLKEVAIYEHNKTVLESIDRIRHTNGTILVKELYSTLDISKSKLEQHFNREIGLTPKEFCKIEKINRFINSYLSNKDQNLTEITYKCGYYDQSHLIKDFKYFLNISPGKFFKNMELLTSFGSGCSLA